MNLISFASLGRVLTLQNTHVTFFDDQIFCWRWSEKDNKQKGRKKKEREDGASTTWESSKLQLKVFKKQLLELMERLLITYKTHLERMTLNNFMLLCKRA